MKIHVLLCDDHTILRDGLQNLLQAEEDIEVVGQAGSGKEALFLAENLLPDVVLLDINMPEMNGIEVTEQLLQRFPKLRILILSMHNQEEYLFNSLRAGAKGYLLKDSPISEVTHAIRRVMLGKSVFHPDLTEKIVASYQNTNGEQQLQERLSKREHEVLREMVKGLPNRTIAEQLFISETTVKLHISHIFRKLGVKSRSQAVLHAVREKIIYL